jgi:hypothetical protein
MNTFGSWQSPIRSSRSVAIGGFSTHLILASKDTGR